MPDLLDVNVWFSLSSKDHIHHDTALKYWEEAASEHLIFCRSTVLGLLRVCAQHSSPGGKTNDVHQAWAIYEGWRRHPGVFLAPDPLDMESCLTRWLHEGVDIHKTWTDAYLASFAVSASLRLVSFDRDFRRFPGLEFLCLQP